jgi:hypothetical protein
MVMNRFSLATFVLLALFTLTSLTGCDSTQSYRLPTKEEIKSSFKKIKPKEGTKTHEINDDDAFKPETKTDSATNIKTVKGEAREQISYEQAADTSDGNFFSRMFNRDEDEEPTKAPVIERNVTDQNAPTTSISINSPYDDIESPAKKSVMIEAEKSFDACPHIAVISELSQLYRFTPSSSTDPNKLESSVQTLLLEENCVVIGDEMKIQLTFGFRGEIGPKAKVKPEDRTSFSYPYFIAITKGRNEIITKRIHAITMAYDADQNTIITQDIVDETLPSDINSDDVKILIGFQLTPEQLTYNRNTQK